MICKAYCKGIYEHFFWNLSPLGAEFLVTNVEIICLITLTFFYAATVRVYLKDIESWISIVVRMGLYFFSHSLTHALCQVIFYGLCFKCSKLDFSFKYPSD
ncbi:hypothetical protein OIU76_004972 [Salix suchowensis]|nr:hypothetical protein OIU76_004972 [Salix suchowensis]